MLFLQKKQKNTLISIILPMIVNKSLLKVSTANAQNVHPQTSTQTHTYPSAVDQMSVFGKEVYFDCFKNNKYKFKNEAFQSNYRRAKSLKVLNDAGQLFV